MARGTDLPSARLTGDAARTGQSPARPSSAGAWVATLAAGAGLVLVQFSSFGTDLGRWDFLFLSGVLTLIAALWVARGQPAAFDAMVGRLVSRGQLDPPDAASKLAAEIKENEKRWSTIGGSAGAILLAALFVVVYAIRGGDEEVVVAVGGPLAGAVGGFLAGRVIGRMALFSTLTRSIARADEESERKRVELSVSPGHPDGAVGLKPLGDFFLAQAMLLAVPAAFLFIWTLLFFLPAFEDRYGDWRGIYIGLFLLAIAIEIAAFFIPLWRVHQVMKDAKVRLAAEADEKAREITGIKAELEKDLEATRREQLKDRLSEVTSAYYAIEKMPTWPIDASARRWLTLGNGALILSLVSQAAGLFGGS
jgi:hypothetical protein